MCVCVCCRRQFKFSCRTSQRKHRSSSPSATQETWLAHYCMSPLVYNNFNCLRASINVLFCTLVGEKSSAASETTELCRRLEKKICNLNSLGSKLKMENQGQLLLHVLLQVKYCGYETLTCCCVAQEWLRWWRHKRRSSAIFPHNSSDGMLSIVDVA